MSAGILVTGAGGFSGSHVAVALRDRGYDVVAVAGRRGKGRLEGVIGHPSRFTIVCGDLADDGFELPQGVQAVVHAAATSPAPGVTDADMVRDNVVATRRLLAQAETAGVTTFIYLSSLSIHGEVTGTELDETTPIVNPDTYGLTKLLGERMLAALAPKMRGLAIRLPGVLGRDSVRNWLTEVLAAARDGRDITVFNAAAPFNNAAHVDDLAAFVAHAIADQSWRGFAAVPVGAGGMTSVGEAVAILVDGAGARSRILDRGTRRPCFTISSEAALARGYRPQEITAMLRRFVAENDR
jgi:nucleoside-diphosphate-sugar epimerase